MSQRQRPFDSFLPSGAIDSPLQLSNVSSSAISPLSGIPPSMPVTGYMAPPHQDTPSPKSLVPGRSPNQHTPISPPKTRSPSAENNSTCLLDDWRAYTANLRSQNEGERAHMAADRARMEEVMAEERFLWDKEREYLKLRIVELEDQLETKEDTTALPIGQRGSSTAAQHDISSTRSDLNAESISGSNGAPTKTIPQESGRNADGSPFYAPAPRNPSRIFEGAENSELRIDSVHTPQESAIRIASKEFTPSDFVQSPPSGPVETSSMLETHPESIDISHIQPELDGVPIKASAVSPTFAAKVRSPQYSPDKISPNTRPPGRDLANHDRNDKTTKTLEVVNQTENRRLTLHAGHTPNHSISKLAWLKDNEDDGGDATPRQRQPTEHMHRPSIAPDPEDEGYDQGDKELRGPLGLTNDVSKDDVFLAQLVERLEEAKKSQPGSPGNKSTSSPEKRPLSTHERKETNGDKDEGPILRLKPSINFGRPMGSM